MTEYAVYRCPVCPLGDCGERDGSRSGGTCEMPFTDVLVRLTDTDYWPVCLCCGAEAELVVPLVKVET